MAVVNIGNIVFSNVNLGQVHRGGHLPLGFPLVLVEAAAVVDPRSGVDASDASLGR